MAYNVIVIVTTCASRKEANTIVASLLKRRLIACGNIMPEAVSRFWWNGKINTAKEVMVIMKTRKGDFKSAEKEIKRLHSYEVPEIIALPVVAGSAEYINWIKGETG